MKRCITTHTVTTFGEIPAGSLWDDDSPFLTDDTAGYFVDADAPADPEPELKPVRKFKPKAVD